MRAMFRRLLAVVLLPILFLPCAPAAHAAVISQDWHAPGDGLLTLDTVTGLQWLDVTVTQGLSWDDSTAQLAPGGPLAGFRRPSEAEVARFWADAGIPNIGGPFNATAANYLPVTALQQLWGTTGAPFSIPGPSASTFVTTGESFDPVDDMVEGTALLRVFDSDGTAAAQIRVLLGRPPTESFSFLAHALVEAIPPIPEPSTIMLFVIGIASGGLMRIRAKAQQYVGRELLERPGGTGGALYVTLWPADALTPTGRSIMRVHSFLSTFMWVYLGGHVVMALWHQYVGHGTLRRMFSFGRRS